MTAGEERNAELPERFSDFIVYVDESGDHGLHSIDDSYPMFVLAFCVFQKETYANVVTPMLQKFKFKHCGHDMVILHEHDFRKTKGDFRFLFQRERREPFYRDLHALMEEARFEIIACSINKHEFKKAYGPDHSLYDVAIRSCLRRLHRYMSRAEQGERVTHVVFESRGKREDDELELEFRRFCNNKLPFECRIADKRINSYGLQLADLVARPIGQICLRPNQKNRTYDILRGKFASEPGDPHFGLDQSPDASQT